MNTTHSNDPHEPQILIVPADADGQRLDQYVTGALKRSRADVQRKIQRGEVRLADRESAKDLRVETGWKVVIMPDAEDAPEPVNVPNPEIIFEDDDILVLNKPSGLTMHGGTGITEPTLADWLMANRATLTTVGEDQMRPGIIHRLDSDASGVVLIAKNQSMYAFLKTAFQEHRVEKHYTTLVHGRIEREEDTIAFPIERSPHDGLMSAKPVGTTTARDARTHFTVTGRFPAFTLLDITTDTGRTHQVRVHLQAYGHPIAGDPLYHGRGTRPKVDAPRLFLHATSISFEDPTGNRRSFEAPLPTELEGFVASVRRS